jgi:hypothetical protein
MSINTLKKKSKRFQDKISGKEQGFAINGTFRNQGWVGQSSMGRTLAHTPFRGIAPMGNGGHQGKYRINIIESNGTSITNNSTMVKRSNMNTNGHLLATVEHPTSVFVNDCSGQCQNIWVKDFSPLNNSQSTYIDKTARNNIKVLIKPNAGIHHLICDPTMPEYCSGNGHHIGGKLIPNKFYTKELNYLKKGGSDYIRTALMTKNDLPTPPCKASYPPKLNHNSTCQINFQTPQDAINAGVLSQDWMNCDRCGRAARPYTTTNGKLTDLESQMSQRNIGQVDLCKTDGQKICSSCGGKFPGGVPDIIPITECIIKQSLCVNFTQCPSNVTVLPNAFSYYDMRILTVNKNRVEARIDVGPAMLVSNPWGPITSYEPVPWFSQLKMNSNNEGILLSYGTTFSGDLTGKGLYVYSTSDNGNSWNSFNMGPLIRDVPTPILASPYWYACTATGCADDGLKLVAVGGGAVAVLGNGSPNPSPPPAFRDLLAMSAIFSSTDGSTWSRVSAYENLVNEAPTAFGGSVASGRMNASIITSINFMDNSVNPGGGDLVLITRKTPDNQLHNNLLNIPIIWERRPGGIWKLANSVALPATEPFYNASLTAVPKKLRTRTHVGTRDNPGVIVLADSPSMINIINIDVQNNLLNLQPGCLNPIQVSDTGYIECIACSENGDIVFFGTSDGEIIYINIYFNDEANIIQQLSQNNRFTIPDGSVIKDISCDLDGQTVAITTENGKIYICNDIANLDTQTKEYIWKGVAGEVCSEYNVSIHNDLLHILPGGQLLTAGRKKINDSLTSGNSLGCTTKYTI